MQKKDRRKKSVEDKANPQRKKPEEIRSAFLQVRVRPDEKEHIEKSAALANMSTGAFMRSVSLGVEIRSKIDQQAVIDLAKVAGNQGRLGGILKKIITLAENTSVHPSEIRPTLRKIEIAQEEIRQIIEELKKF